MLFISIVIFANILYAFAFIGDKLVVEKTIRNPLVFTFIINVIGVLGALFWFADLRLPTNFQLGLGVLCGLSFVLSNLFYLITLKNAPATIVAPMYGGIATVATLFISLALGTYFNNFEVIGIFFLTISFFIFAFINHLPHGTNKIFSTKSTIAVLIGGLLLGIYIVTFESLSKSAGFPIAFSVARIAAAAFCLTFLFSKTFSNDLKEEKKQKRSRVDLVALSGRVMGATANVLIAYSISIGSGGVVQAMQGGQYIFILPLTYLFAKKFPQVFKEQKSTKIICIKIVGIAFVVTGLVLIGIGVQ